MRTALLIGALLLGCSSGQERPAKQPEAPSESEEADGFTQEQKEALSELLGDDQTEEEPAEDPPPTP